jgi:hypothetical protein
MKYFAIVAALALPTNAMAAPQLSLQNVMADVTIQVSTASNIEVQVTGDAEKEISVSRDPNGDVSLTGAQTNTIVSRNGAVVANGNVSVGAITTGDCSPVIIGSTVVNGITCNGQTMRVISQPRPRITITLPRGAKILVRGGVGSIMAGDIVGPLDISLAGSGTAAFGRVTTAEVSVTGSAVVTVAEVAKEAELKVTGSGNIDIAHGTIDSLEADVTGSGTIRYQGVFREAELNVTGSGDIIIPTCVNARQSIAGSGTIRCR